MEIILIALMSFVLILMAKVIRRNKNQIRLLKGEMAKVAEEAAREIVTRLFMGEDTPLTKIGIASLAPRPSEAQKKVKEFVISCLSEGIENNAFIMGQIEERNADLIKFVKYWDSEEFIKLLIAKINEYQLQ